MASGRAAGFADYLERALAALETEAPTHFAATRDHLGGLAAAIRVGAAPAVRVCLGGGRPWTRPHRDADSAADVEVTVAERDLHDLLQGELTIEEALAADRLAIRGELDRILALLDALQAWLHGALRSPSLPLLHRQYLGTDEKGAWP